MKLRQNILELVASQRKIPYNIGEFVGKNLGNKEGNIEFNVEIYTKVR